jgi:hypothetical protein
MARLFGVLVLACACIPALADAQGGRGGFGGGAGRGRGERSQSDTTAAGAPAPKLSFVDMVFAHRAQLQLTDSQMVVVGDIRMKSAGQRTLLTREADSVKALMTVTPEESPVAPTDSSRKAMMLERRALGALLGDLHDVDFNGRKETLLALSPLQQQKAELLEEMADAPPSGKPQDAESGGGGRRGNRGGGMGHP